MGRLFDDCNSVMSTIVSDDPYRTAHDEEDGILIHDSRDPDDDAEREAMLLPSIKDRLAEAVEWLLAEKSGDRKCGHADSGPCVCAQYNAEAALRLHNNEKKLAAIKAAEIAQSFPSLGDVFGQFNEIFGRKS
jgi:hypothetical protein